MCIVIPPLQPRQAPSDCPAKGGGRHLMLTRVSSSVLEYAAALGCVPQKRTAGPPRLGDDPPGGTDGSPRKGNGSPGRADDSPRRGDGSPGGTDSSTQRGNGSPRWGEGPPGWTDDPPRRGNGSPGRGDRIVQLSGRTVPDRGARFALSGGPSARRGEHPAHRVESSPGRCRKAAGVL